MAPSCVREFLHAIQLPQRVFADLGPDPKQPGNCERCGYITSQAVCKACVMLEGLNSGNPRMGVQRVRGKQRAEMAAAAAAKADEGSSAQPGHAAVDDDVGLPSGRGGNACCRGGECASHGAAREAACADKLDASNDRAVPEASGCSTGCVVPGDCGHVATDAGGVAAGECGCEDSDNESGRALDLSALRAALPV